MTRIRLITLTPLALISALTLAACGGGGGDAPQGAAGTAGTTAAGEASGTITVTDNNGTVEVPTNPARVVALDNTSFETLADMGVTPVAAPKQLLPSALNEWQSNSNVIDVGTHREPQLEAINEARPDLIIGGKRFEEFNPTLSAIAPVVDLAPDVEEDGYIDKLKTQTTTLGQIFGQGGVAENLNAELDQSVADAAGRTNGQTVFLANHNGGRIDNGAGRMSPLLQPLDMVDVFARQDAGGSDSIHQDSGLAPETVAQANPDWLFVMDRDAATSSNPGTTASPAEGTTALPAEATVEAQTAWANTTFVTEDQIVYLEPDFYLTEGIHAYTDAYNAIGAALAESQG